MILCGGCAVHGMRSAIGELTLHVIQDKYTSRVVYVSTTICQRTGKLTSDSTLLCCIH
jgi:hypothetical protein